METSAMWRSWKMQLCVQQPLWTVLIESANYLARFLLAYDVPSRRLWRERAAEIPVSWSRQQVIDARTTHL